MPLREGLVLVHNMLVGFGLASDPAIYQRSLGINVNLWWGLVQLAFGLAMLWLARRGSRGGEA